MASSPENHMHLRPGDKPDLRFVDKELIRYQLELLRLEILQHTSDQVKICCTHSKCLLHPAQPLRIIPQYKATPDQVKDLLQAGPIPTMIVEIKADDPNQLIAIRIIIEQLCLNSPFVTMPVYPRQMGELNSDNQITFTISLSNNRHRTVS